MHTLFRIGQEADMMRTMHLPSWTEGYMHGLSFERSVGWAFGETQGGDFVVFWKFFQAAAHGSSLTN